MHGDISRSTFDRRAGYRAVVHQQGRVTLDADLNEQADIAAYHDEVRMLDLIGRTGGPRPVDPAAPGPFAIRAEEGDLTKGVDWEKLVVTPGRYYVDGVLVESHEVTKPVMPLAAEDGDRYALYLEVSERSVTADEEPRLRESALGGPDTALRRKTTWQVKAAKLEHDETCSDLDESWLVRTPRPMACQLKQVPPEADPCRITTAGGYSGLENQLYRVQIYAEADGATPPTFLWSRENGSVVARITDRSSEALRVTLDREGRDPELMIRAGDLVELSPDREANRVPGPLAVVQRVTGLDLYLAPHAPSATAQLKAALDASTIVRRWDGGPLNVDKGWQDLEDGIQVRFLEEGIPRAGDYWQVPARTMQLAYGLPTAQGTIEWPPLGSTVVPDKNSSEVAVEPTGPARRIAPLGIVKLENGSWVLDHDCRKLFSPLTEASTSTKYARIVRVEFLDKNPSFQNDGQFQNDMDVDARQLSGGFAVEVDTDLIVVNNPNALLWVELDLPWPVTKDDAEFWGLGDSIGYHPVCVEGDVGMKGNRLHWLPGNVVKTWFKVDSKLWVDSSGRPGRVSRRSVTGRFLLRGGAMLTTDGRSVSARPIVRIERGQVMFDGTSDPTSADIYTQWFRLNPPSMPELRNMSVDDARHLLKELGINLENVSHKQQGRGRGVIDQEPKAGEAIDPNTQVTLVFGAL